MYIKAEVRYFPVVTKQTRLISYLLWPFRYEPQPAGRAGGGTLQCRRWKRKGWEMGFLQGWEAGEIGGNFVAMPNIFSNEKN